MDTQPEARSRPRRNKRPVGRPQGTPYPGRMGKARPVPTLNYAIDRAALMFAENLEATLKAHDVAASELAATLGVSEFTVYAWTGGRSCPHLGRIVQVAWALGCSVNSLVGDCQ